MSKFKTHIDKYPLPPSVEGICSLVREVLNSGHIKRIEVDQDDSFVRAFRWVNEADDLEEDNVSWSSAIRNLPELLEYYSEGASPYQVLVDLSLLVSSKKLFAIHWLCGSIKLLEEWLELEERGMPVSTEHLLGVPVAQLKDLPEDSLILCCAPFSLADAENVTFGIKTIMERSSHVDKNNDTFNRSGSGSKERSGPVSFLEADSRRLRKIDWKPDYKS